MIKIRSLGTAVVLRTSPGFLLEISGREGRAGSTGAMLKSGPEPEGRGCQVVAHAT